MEETKIEVEDGEEISTALHSSDSDRWIFFCHGFGSDKQGSYKRRCERAVKEGWNAVRFTFRGNGESDGDFIEQDLSSRIKDLNAVIDHFEPESYVIFGMSFGGKVVFHQAIEDEDVKAVVAKSAVTFNGAMQEFKEGIDRNGEFTLYGEKTVDRRFIEDLDSYRFTQVTRELSVPVCMFHGRSDTTVDPEFTWKAARELEKSVRVEMYDGEGHHLSDNAEEKLLDSMFQWLEKLDIS